jgi:hypothetical protein
MSSRSVSVRKNGQRACMARSNASRRFRPASRKRLTAEPKP